MMKLEAEIKDDRLIFKYTIGKSSHNSDMSITPDALIAFTSILKFAADAYWGDNQRKKELLKQMTRFVDLSLKDQQEE